MSEKHTTPPAQEGATPEASAYTTQNFFDHIDLGNADSVDTGEQANIERTYSKEEKEQLFHEALKEGQQLAFDLIRERFEQSPEITNHLEYHNVRHTEGVIRRFDQIMDVLRNIDPSYTERSNEMGRLAAAHHDTVQNWKPLPVMSTNPGEEGMMSITRKRFVGENESESTAGAIKFMNVVNEKTGTLIFTEEDKLIVRGGHDATIPGFNPALMTVIQPNLSSESTLVTRAIALADLGTAGMEGPDAYLPEGDALFREENLDIAEAMSNPSQLTPRRKQFYRERMLRWSQSQESFAKGRKAQLQSELLDQYPKEAEEELRNLFGKFDESIQAAHAQSERRASLSFEELATDMGYHIGESPSASPQEN